MQEIRSQSDLRVALKRLRRFQLREQQGRKLYEKYRNMIVRWMEKKNRKQAMDADGNKWQKRQAVRLVYPDNAKDLRKLLKAKGVDVETVISVVRPDPVTQVNEDEILRLLKQKVISPAEFERVIIRQTYTPFLVRANAKERESKAPRITKPRGHDKDKRGSNSAGTGKKLRKGGRAS